MGLIILMSLMFVSCFTGVEGTKTITLSRNDKKTLALTAEDTILECVKGFPLGQWKAGKRFIITDDRINLLLDQSLSDRSVLDLKMKDNIVFFHSLADRKRPDGSSERMIILRTLDNKFLYYPTSKKVEGSENTVLSSGLPMLIDLDMIEKVRDILNGKKVWIKSPIWYDEADSRIPGRKFVAVNIEDVSHGSLYFPVKIKFSDEKGKIAYIFMNFGNSDTDSRSFAKLFSLNNPRARFSAMEDDVWNLICNGRVKVGMTKEQCRLALGNPVDVKSGHDYNRLLDVWIYEDGDYLQFSDGLLVNFRLLK